ncbi:acyltransferase 3 [Rhizobium sp. CF080]|uniref:acyltransferase family protein n=1 Tax=Rhizobium sp. (strain CF080) TaxID=1144310 RepID=UPI000271B48A|nr:acyltransferase family protein [Rhizobium sp. CF080]EUB98708.1 acyltransferase 3 [Rhizobium sp. CF080]
MRYRAEIDGLRAIAVLPVVLFHAGIAFAAGGFIGVDVFFVISGYLITTKIAEDVARGNFNLLQFYERRARRILPLLLLILAFAIPVFFIILMPSDYTRFIRSVFASLKLTSDIFFARSGGYFEDTGSVRPLLHTWSLSIEEKYYLIFPVSFYVAYRIKPKKIITITIVSVALLFLYSIYATYRSADTAYFMFTARAWEILSGAFIAVLLGKHGQPALSAKTKDMISAVALASLAFCLYHFDEHISYPGLYATVPVASTVALIVAAGDDTIIGRALASRLLVWVGLLSYSIYMWHQPVIVAAEVLGYFSNASQKVLVIGLIVFISYLSWRFVEQPFRRTSVIGRKMFLSVSVASIGLVILSSYLMRDLDQSRLAKVTPANGVSMQLVDKCFLLDTAVSEFAASECVFTPGPGRKVLLIGDSHSASLYPGLKQYGAENGFEVALASAAYCLPVVESFPPNTSQTATSRCQKINKQISAMIQAMHPDLVVISGYMFLWSSATDAKWTYPGYYQQFLEQLKALAQITPTMVVGQFPIWNGPLPDIVAVEIGIGKKTLSDIDRFDGKSLRQGLFEFDRKYKADVGASGARYVSILDKVCRQGECPRYESENGGSPELMTQDYGHLSLLGSRFVANTVVGPALREALAMPKAF